VRGAVVVEALPLWQIFSNEHQNATRAEERMLRAEKDRQPEGVHHNEAQHDSRQPAQIGSRRASKNKRICLFCGLPTSIFSNIL